MADSKKNGFTETALNTAAADAFLQWLSLSETQRRSFQALAGEIDTASSLVSVSVEKLTDQFRDLAGFVTEQSQQLESVLGGDNRFVVDGQELSLADLFEELQEYLGDPDRKSAETSERIAKIAQSVEEQNQSRAKAFQDSAKRSEEISRAIRSMITSMQFQDRTAQRLELIKETLKFLSTLTMEQENQTRETFPNLGDVTVDAERIMNAVSQLHLGEMRERFVKNALEGNVSGLDGDDWTGTASEGEVEHSDASDDVELF